MTRNLLWLTFAVTLAGCGDDIVDPGEPEPVLSFTDISAQSPDLFDAPFKGNPGWNTSDKYSPGVAMADLDGDGFLDLVQPRNDSQAAEFSTPRLYRGVGDGTFVDATPADWDVTLRSPAALTADFDADGDLDIFIGVDGAPSVLFRNEGGMTFTDISVESGIAAYSDRVFVASAGDVDNDGDVDLYTGSWNASVPGHGLGTAPNRIFLNDGTGVFTELVGEAQCEGRATLGSTLVDLDRDGDLDIYVVNDFFDDCLYRNNGDGTFTDIAPDVGTDKGAISGMGVVAGDINGDGTLDLFVTDGVKEDESTGNAVFLNRGGLTFDNAAHDLGLAWFEGQEGPNIMFGWGAGIQDFDADGDNDIHVNTHITIEELFWQNTPNGFELARNIVFGGLPDADSRGSAYGDIDGDGDIDIIVARRGDGRYVEDPTSLQILRNTTVTPHETLVVDVRPYHLAPGSIVKLTTTDGKSQIQAIQAGNSYASSSPMTAIFGLGTAEGVTSVEVTPIGLPPVLITDVGAGRVSIDVATGLATQ